MGFIKCGSGDWITKFRKKLQKNFKFFQETSVVENLEDVGSGMGLEQLRAVYSRNVDKINQTLSTKYSQVNDGVMLPEFRCRANELFSLDCGLGAPGSGGGPVNTGLIGAFEDGVSNEMKLQLRGLGDPVSRYSGIIYAKDHEGIYRPFSNVGVEVLNLFPESRDLTSIDHTGTPIVRYDEVGTEGEPNTASYVEDNTGTLDYVSQTVSVSVGSEDKDTHVAKFWIKKDSDETRFPALGFFGNGGFTSAKINTKTGAVIDSTASSKVPASRIESRDEGDWWTLMVEWTDAGASDNITIRAYPAYSSAWVSASNAASVGSIVMGNMEFHANRDIADVEGLPPQVTPALEYEPVWEGGRVVENLVKSSEDLTRHWGKTGATIEDSTTVTFSDSFVALISPSIAIDIDSHFLEFIFNANTETTAQLTCKLGGSGVNQSLFDISDVDQRYQFIQKHNTYSSNHVAQIRCQETIERVINLTRLGLYDRSPEVYGHNWDEEPERIINGGFDTPDSWSTVWDISGGVANAPVSVGNLEQKFDIPFNAVFKIEFDTVGTYGNGLYVRIGSLAHSIYIASEDGHHIYYGVNYYQPPGVGGLRFRAGSADFQGTLDNVSIKYFNLEPSDYIQTGDKPVKRVYSTTNGNSVLDNIVTETQGVPLDPPPVLKVQQEVTNEFRESRNASGLWSISTGGTLVNDVVGIDGTLNAGVTLTDSSTTDIVTSGYTSGGIPVRGDPYVFKMWVGKEDDESSFPEIVPATFSGPGLSIQINRKTGEYKTRGDQSPEHTIEVLDDGDCWILIAQVTQDVALTGNLSIAIYPAMSTTLGTYGGPSKVGHVIIKQIEFHYNRTLDQVRNLGPIFTEQSKLSTGKTEYSFDPRNLNEHLGGLTLEVQSDISQLICGDFLMWGLGPDLVTNGKFDTDSNWGKGGGWTIADGLAGFEYSGSDYSSLIQNLGLSSTSTYRLTFQCVDVTEEINVFLGQNGSATDQYHVLSSGWHSFINSNPGAGDLIFRGRTIPCVAHFDDVSVRELGGSQDFSIMDISGNVASQVGEPGVNKVGLAWSAEEGTMSINVGGSWSLDAVYSGDLGEDFLELFKDQLAPGTLRNIRTYSGGSYQELKDTIDEVLPSGDFQFTMRTTSSQELVTLPTSGGNFEIDWGDGTTSSSTILEPSHTYEVAGDYQLSIQGSVPYWGFKDSGDKLKLISVENLGQCGWSNLEGGFHGCSNLESFRLGNGDTSEVTTMERMFSGLGAVGYMGIERFSIESLVSLEDFALDTTFTTEDYDKILINWEAQVVQPNVTAGFGTSKFTSGGTAEASRNSLIAQGWVISDGGPA